MKISASVPILFFWFAGSVGGLAQINCSPSPNAKLVCLVPFVTNGDPTKSVALNAPIGAQLSQLPFAASVSGSVSYRDAQGDVPYYNLGPIIVDRPDSVGEDRLVFGFGFQQFNFNSLSGLSLGSLPFTYCKSSGGNPNCTTDNSLTPGSTVYYSQNQHISFKYDQYLALATYGLPNNTDVTLLLPFARVSVDAGTLPGGYGIQDLNGILSSVSPIVNHSHGSASGLGDISLNLKHVIWAGGETERTSVAAGGTLRIPSGDAQNYLGSGAYGFNLYALAAYKAPISPHVRIAYQWNGSTVLLNPTGVGDTRLPGGLQYAVGIDAMLIHKITFSIDLLGNQFLNSPTFVKAPDSNFPTQPPAPSTAPNTVTPGTSSYTTVTLSSGLKYKPFKKRPDIVIYGNMLTQVNNVGLRSDLVPSGGISYSFSPRKQ